MNEDNTSVNGQTDDLIKDIKLRELLDIPSLQDLSNSFFNLTGMPLAILDIKGDILIASGWKRICTEFHRKNSISASRCLESDTVLASELKKGQQFNLYRCKNGLIDVATPIILGNRHFGNLFAGQFLLEKPDLNYFINQAEQFGFDKDQYLEALADVPILTESQVKKTMKYLRDLTVIIVNGAIEPAPEPIWAGCQLLKIPGGFFSCLAHVLTTGLKTAHKGASPHFAFLCHGL